MTNEDKLKRLSTNFYNEILTIYQKEINKLYQDNDYKESNAILRYRKLIAVIDEINNLIFSTIQFNGFTETSFYENEIIDKYIQPACDDYEKEINNRLDIIKQTTNFKLFFEQMKELEEIVTYDQKDGYLGYLLDDYFKPNNEYSLHLKNKSHI